MLVVSQAADFISLELTRDSASLDATLAAFAELVQSLPAKARDDWVACSLRRFNIGIQAGNVPHQTCLTISQQTISQLADIQGEIAITVYAPIDGADFPD